MATCGCACADQLAAALAELDTWRTRATHDPLTGLHNRTGLTRLWGERGPGGWLVLVDLDQFKPVNDTHGHAAGDEVLRIVSTRLGVLGVTARLGGDEFALIVSRRGVGRLVVDTLRLGMSLRCGATVMLSASAGVTAASGDLGARLGEADAAMYRAKSTGGDAVVAFDPLVDDRPAGGVDRHRRGVRDLPDVPVPVLVGV